jgi:SAM-dependent methyltransferase
MAAVILNLGCGTRTSPAMINIDWSLYARLAQHKLGRRLAATVLQGDRRARFEAMDGTIQAHDLRKGIPVPAGSADAVYHSHVIEHIDRDAVPGFLTEIHRVLKPGGVHRIVCPDLEQLALAYSASLAEGGADHDRRVEAIIGQCVRREASGTSRQPPVRRRIENLVLGDARRRGETHQWMWDRVNLAAALTAAGFADVAVVDARTSSIPGWAAMNLDVVEDGSPYIPGSLYVEARR